MSCLDFRLISKLIPFIQNLERMMKNNGCFLHESSVYSFLWIFLGDSAIRTKKELLIYVGKIITITLEMRLNRDIFAKFKHISERDELFYTITFFVF